MSASKPKITNMRPEIKHHHIVSMEHLTDALGRTFPVFVMERFMVGKYIPAGKYKNTRIAPLHRVPGIA